VPRGQAAGDGARHRVARAGAVFRASEMGVFEGAQGPLLTAAEQGVYDALQAMGEADAGALGEALGKHRTSVWRVLRRFQVAGHVASREERHSGARARGSCFVPYKCMHRLHTVEPCAAPLTSAYP
jgi:hypothetical protein